MGTASGPRIAARTRAPSDQTYRPVAAGEQMRRGGSGGSDAAAARRSGCVRYRPRRGRKARILVPREQLLYPYANVGANCDGYRYNSPFKGRLTVRPPFVRGIKGYGARQRVRWRARFIDDRSGEVVAVGNWCMRPPASASAPCSGAVRTRRKKRSRRMRTGRDRSIGSTCPIVGLGACEL